MNKARRLLHRDSSPLLSFGGLKNGSISKGETKGRRKSEGMLSLPEELQQGPKTTQQTPKWYVKSMKREEAEEILLRNKFGTFLVRDSETSQFPGAYTISLRHRDKCRHHKIETNPNTNKLVLKGNERFQFPNLKELIAFFITTQKDIKLIPYDPEAIHEEDVPDGPQPVYEEMDALENTNQDEYQVMDKVSGPPPLPSRVGNATVGPTSSYENVNKKKVPPPPAPPKQSYENVPGKGSAPPPPTANSALLPPPLPPRVNTTAGGSYENMPKRPPPPSPGSSYENVGGKQNASTGYQNHSLKPSSPPPSQGHSYQNLPPKVTPRKMPTYYSAEQVLPPRPKQPGLRRSKTESEAQWMERDLPGKYR